MKSKRKMVPLMVRILEKLKTGRREECWNWTGADNGTGYGRTSLDSKPLLVHRAMYEFCFGPIPSDMLVLHKCDNRRCANPMHLFLGTHLDNNRDAMKKNRHSWGERHPCSKLTATKVTQMRNEYANGRTVLAISKKHKINYNTVQNAVKRHTWKSLKE